MRVLLLAALFATVGLAGCADVNDSNVGQGPESDAPSSGGASGSGGAASGSSPALGSASLYVQDAPEDDFAEVHVVFTHVTVHAAGAESDANETESGNGTASNETAEAESDGAWIEIVNATDGIDVDLLNVTGARAALLGEEDLLAGKYTQIRIHTTSAYGIDHDGNRVNISLANPILKVVKSFNVETGMESRILVDVDLAKSLKQTGQSGWKLTPVIGKTIVDIVEDASSGEDAHTVGDGTELEDIGSA